MPFVDSSVLRIPLDREWVDVNTPCSDIEPTYAQCPVMVDMDEPLRIALETIEEMCPLTVRTPPAVISRLYRGGKTTLLRRIFASLVNNSTYYPIIVSLNGDFALKRNESNLDGLLRAIASQLVVKKKSELEKFVCSETDFCDRLDEIQSITG